MCDVLGIKAFSIPGPRKEESLLESEQIDKEEGDDEQM